MIRARDRMAEDRTTATREYIQYRPKHKVDLRLRFQLPKRFIIGLYAGYVSSQVYYDGSDRLTLDPYTVVDFNVSKQLGEKWRLFLRINNLFDVDYYESEGFPREGRTVSAGIRFGTM